MDLTHVWISCLPYLLLIHLLSHSGCEYRRMRRLGRMCLHVMNSAAAAGCQVQKQGKLTAGWKSISFFYISIVTGANPHVTFKVFN